MPKSSDNRLFRTSNSRYRRETVHFAPVSDVISISYTVCVPFCFVPDDAAAVVEAERSVADGDNEDLLAFRWLWILTMKEVSPISVSFSI